MTRRKALAALLAVAVVAFGAAMMRPGMQARAALTTQDYIDIQQLYARYAHAADRSDGKAWSEVFTPDGQFYGPGTIPANNGLLDGRAQIAAFLKGPVLERPAVRHNYSNIVITPTVTGAAGSAYLVLTNLETASIIGGGTYDDVLVKSAEGWRFKKRTYMATARKPVPQAQTSSR